MMSNKYGAKRTWSELCKRWFASKAECRRGEDLRMLEMVGEIYDLGYQPKFVLCDKPKVTITLDFVYNVRRPLVSSEGDTSSRFISIYEDVKGVLTRDSRTKLAWLRQSQGIDVKLIR